jgi:hypothetical protein
MTNNYPMPAAEEIEKPKTAHVKKSVSLPPDLMAAAIKRAEHEQRNFSNYIQKLITRDLAPAAKDSQEAAA